MSEIDQFCKHTAALLRRADERLETIETEIATASVRHDLLVSEREEAARKLARLEFDCEQFRAELRLAIKATDELAMKVDRLEERLVVVAALGTETPAG